MVAVIAASRVLVATASADCVNSLDCALAASLILRPVRASSVITSRLAWASSGTSTALHTNEVVAVRLAEYLVGPVSLADKLNADARAA